jgi:hypothetical protein
MSRHVRKGSLMLLWVGLTGCAQFEEPRHPPIVPRPVTQGANPNGTPLRPGMNTPQGNAAFPQVQPQPYSNNSSSSLNNRTPQPAPSPFAASNNNQTTLNPQAPPGALGTPYTPGVVPAGPTSPNPNTGFQSQISTPYTGMPNQ